MQCESGNSKIVIGDGGSPPAGAELLRPRGQLVRPGLKRMVNVKPGTAHATRMTASAATPVGTSFHRVSGLPFISRPQRS